MVSDGGDIQYSEIPRQNVRKLESYVKEMASGGAVEPSVNLDKVQADIGESRSEAALTVRQALGARQRPALYHSRPEGGY